MLDLGCGLSTDGIYFAMRGAEVTFADIVQDNLRATERATRVAGVHGSYYLISDLERFDLPHQYDCIMAMGSLQHAPFDLVRRESRRLRRSFVRAACF